MTTRLSGSLIAAFICVALTVPAIADAATGDITTVAGTGSAGLGADNIAATSSALSPIAISPTPDGGFLIAEASNNRIRKVSAGGIITTIAGTGTAGVGADNIAATSSALSAPDAVASTPDGGYLIVDSGNNRIRKVSAGGIITTVAGTGTAGAGAENVPATSSALSSPSSVAPTPDGGFLIADVSNNRIRKVSAGSIITTVAGTGAAGAGADNVAATTSALNGPISVSPTPDGGFLIDEFNNNRIRKVSPAGIITTVAGTGSGGAGADNVAATSSALNTPYSVASTPDGGFLIAESFQNNRIRKVSPAGIITTVAGTGVSGTGANNVAATSSALNTPTSVAPTPDGGFLLNDTNNYRVRRVEGVATPSVLGTDPPSTANQNTVRVNGNAPAGTGVSLYATADCTGTPLAQGSAALFASPGISVDVPDNSTTTFRATATQSGYTSACSTTSVTYSEVTPIAPPDTRAPQTKLKGGPKGTIKSGTAKFRFSSTESGSKFSCKLDKGKYRSCKSPKTYKKLKPGKHTFLVRATDVAGNTDKTPAKRKFKVAHR